MVSSLQVQTNYICGAASMKSLSYNNLLNCHDEKLVEKTFESLDCNSVFKTTLRTLQL